MDIQFQSGKELLHKLSQNPDSYTIAFQTAQAFEAEKDYVKAYVYYRHAQMLCDLKAEKDFISKNISDFLKAYGTWIPADRVRNYLKEVILSLIQKKEYENALRYYTKCILDDLLVSEMSPLLDDDLVILMIYTNISTQEEQNHILPILNNFTSFEQIKRFYYQFKFYMRRVQFSLPQHQQFEIVEFIEQNNISDFAINMLMTHMEIDKNKDFARKIIKGITHPYHPKAKESVVVSADSEHTFSFILCVSNEDFLSETEVYIRNLNIPDGYAIEIIPIYDAKSMTSGYNQGMNKAQGKYKIYMHEDVFLIYSNMLSDIIRIFSSDNSIGMIGIAGSSDLPDSGMWWNSKKEKTYHGMYIDRIHQCVTPTFPVINQYVQAEIIDGLLMITSKDIPWREDLLNGWHFYDASHSQEFIRQGYQVVIPQMKTMWALHDTHFRWTYNDNEYNRYREIFMKEYYHSDQS
ncbi:MAG: glycosyltransferase family protein [Lachnoclostridium sp.]|jgi:tetratricopeptide (TPR) repeat protein|nr:glycosyltransferase family protein [Lachnoclostridium sp.]